PAPLAAGCRKPTEPPEPRVTAAEVKAQMAQTAESAAKAARTTAQYVDQEKDIYLQKAQAELVKLRGRAAQLRGRFSPAAERATQEALRDVDLRVAGAASRLAALKASSGDVWHKMQVQVDREFGRIDKALKALEARLITAPTNTPAQSPSAPYPPAPNPPANQG
ncbi:MAG: hypothetical protein M1457_00785, partial [bacterium]|nr:hypothetical protein [bacterium]